jgi:sterol desaturase/sphingolipid hydroxylase (fatty acid hydroxylase superfamily)
MKKKSNDFMKTFKSVFVVVGIIFSLISLIMAGLMLPDVIVSGRFGLFFSASLIIQIMSVYGTFLLLAIIIYVLHSIFQKVRGQM